MHKLNKEKVIRRKLKRIQKIALENGIDEVLIKNFKYICDIGENKETHLHTGFKRKIIISVGVACISVLLVSLAVDYLLSARCLLPINHLVWEATRPLADCGYCANVTKPIILQNVTRQSFQAAAGFRRRKIEACGSPCKRPLSSSGCLSVDKEERYAYSSKPIIVKQAVSHWRALKEFNFHMLKKLYEKTAGSYESLEEGCQFLNFKTDLFTLKEVFEMPAARVWNEPGYDPWYVGWGNCHPDILAKLRGYYAVPEFLPEDAEFPATENLFFGYETGAVMHLDYIPRLMWQGQVKGNKIWSVVPVPECEYVCHKFQYYVEPGDVVLLDTRLWYHATSIPKGQFSLTVQSEYG